VSGAPEEVLSRALSVLDDYEHIIRQETTKSRRLIAVASRRLRPGEEKPDISQIEHDLDTAALVSFDDRPRAGVSRAPRPSLSLPPAHIGT
jgi:magnesium-transporting ATPase (P-type)